MSHNGVLSIQISTFVTEETKLNIVQF